MTFTQQCKIVFHKNDRRDDIVIYKVTQITFESSWRELTARGSIILPRKVNLFDKYKVKEIFRRGDALTISFGYDYSIKEEFTGYISQVSADIPMVIRFEDEMLKLRQIPVNFSSSNISLDGLLKKIVTGYEIDALEKVQLGGVRLAKTTMGAVLEKLRSDWGLYSYMRGKTLVVGKYYDTDFETVNFHLERNCVSTSLNYRKKEDVRIRLKVVSTLRNGKKISVDGIGDPDGNERQLSFYNIEVRAQLERLGRLEYEKYKVDKFDGSFTAFGTPSVQHGMKVNLVSSLYEDRNGTYYVEKVVKTFGIGGIRQEITLGGKVA